jgi:hypothetical protein
VAIPEKLPDNFDASEQLFHLRVIGVPCAIAAIEAGFVGKAGKPMNGGNAARLDRHPQIVARKVFLAGCRWLFRRRASALWMARARSFGR